MDMNWDVTDTNILCTRPPTSSYWIFSGIFSGAPSGNQTWLAEKSHDYKQTHMAAKKRGKHYTWELVWEFSRAMFDSDSG